MDFDFKINLVKSTTCLGEDVYLGSIPLRDFIKNDAYIVPVYRSDTSIRESGYQREAKNKRVQEVAERIKADTQDQNECFIDSVNLNLRASNVSKFVRPINPKETSFGNLFEFQYTSVLGQFYVIDGQTRIKGAARAYNDAKTNGDLELQKKIESIQMQISLTFIADVYKEAYIFYLINNYSKSIPPDGATRLLYEGDKDGNVNFKNELTIKGKEDEISGYTIAERMNKHSKIWAGKMKDFNDFGPGVANKTSIRAVALMVVPIIKEVRKSGITGAKNILDKVYKIIEAFWVGFKIAYPDIFDENSSKEYSTLKAGPAEIMTLVLKAMVRDNILNKSKQIPSLIDPQIYAEHLRNIDKVSDNAPSGAQVSGPYIFLSGVGGAIGKYSNNSAKNEMARKICNEVMPWTDLLK